MVMDTWLVPKAPGTHTLMDGGILFVLDEDMDHFFHVYIEELKKNKLYVVEQKTEVFKFFVDLDYKAPEKLNDEFLIKICKCLHDSIGRPGRCCIARAQPRPVKEGIKSGVHIHWPDFKVTKQQALSNRAKILLDLPDVEGINWAQVIDSSVYGGSGLRMLWSHKKPSGDPYIPWRTLDGQDFSKEPNIETLSLFSIRCASNESMTEEELSAPSSDSIEEFIQRYIPGQRRTQVKKIQRMEEGGDSWYIQSDSKYCERIRDEHRSNHIWFLLSKGRVSQRCFNEECKNFVGSEHILPPSIIDEVAPVGSPPARSFMELVTERNLRPVPEVRTGGASIFWSRSSELATLPQ
jgi:hypothetical protein